MLRFAQELSDLQHRVFVWAIDKKFCVLTKLVDFLIEPLVRAEGYDFYANGYAPRFVNHFYAGLKFEGTQELYDATVTIYDNFARSPSHSTLDKMQRAYRMMATSAPEELRFYYELAALGAIRFEHFHDLSTFGNSNEIQLTSVLASVSYWRQRCSDDFELFHDASSNFFRQASTWGAITRDDVEPQMHPLADGSFVEFPLRVCRTISCNSAEHRAIQFCDLLAGLCAKSLKREADDENRSFMNDLLDAGLGQINSNGIRPEFEFPEGPPARATGPDAVDLLVDIMRPTLPRTD